MPFYIDTATPKYAVHNFVYRVVKNIEELQLKNALQMLRLTLLTYSYNRIIVIYHLLKLITYSYLTKLT